MKDDEMTQQSYEEVVGQMLDRLPPERRLRGLTFAQRMVGLSDEEILEALSPEERLRGLTVAQRLAGLSHQEILDALPPKVWELLAKKNER